MAVQVDKSLGLERAVEIDRYNRTMTLMRVTAWVKRFCFNTKRKRKKERKRGGLTLQEITEAECDWITVVRKELRQNDNCKQLVSTFGLTEH